MTELEKVHSTEYYWFPSHLWRYQCFYPARHPLCNTFPCIELPCEVEYCSRRCHYKPGKEHPYSDRPAWECTFCSDFSLDLQKPRLRVNLSPKEHLCWIGRIFCIVGVVVFRCLWKCLWRRGLWKDLWWRRGFGDDR